MPETDREQLTKRIKRAAGERYPETVNWVKRLRRIDGSYLRVRHNSYRAICRLNPPYFLVLVVGERENIYDKVDLAKQRFADAPTVNTDSRHT